MIKDIDFGEIIIDGIPQKTNDATRVSSGKLRAYEVNIYRMKSAE